MKSQFSDALPLDKKRIYLAYKFSHIWPSPEGGGSADAQMAKKQRVSHIPIHIFRSMCRMIVIQSALYSPVLKECLRYPQYYHKMIWKFFTWLWSSKTPWKTVKTMDFWKNILAIIHVTFYENGQKYVSPGVESDKCVGWCFKCYQWIPLDVRNIKVNCKIC